MQEIVIATLILGIIGLLIGIALVAAGKKFHVETDERVELVREYLPGNNCGACGFAGCNAVAEAIVEGSTPASACPVNSDENAGKIGSIMGVEVSATVRKAAFVKCAGDCSHTSERYNYIGIRDCRSAALSGLGVWECDYGCMGFGSCVRACEYDAIHVADGVAVVDPEKCKGCGLCAAACPKNLIDLVPAGANIAVQCSNQDRGPEVKKVCSVGCIGCKLCTRQCEHEAVIVNGNLAHIDYDKCVGCGKCAEKCPSKIIITL